MICSKCGGVVDGRSKKCSFCGTSINQNNDQLSNQPVVDSKQSLFSKYKYFFLGGIVLLVIIIIVVVSLINPKNERRDALLSIDKTHYMKFTIDDKEYYVGEKVSKYKKNGISFEDQYLTEDSYVESDSIAMYNFYDEEKEAQFLGAFYCSENKECKYDDTLLLKVNFYEESEVVIDDFIKYGIRYDDIVEKYGKEDGTFYQDEDLLVWTFGEKGKVGNPYYILRFDYDGWFSSGELIEIRMGIWWYEEEYEHTVIEKKEVEKDEK